MNRKIRDKVHAMANLWAGCLLLMGASALGGCRGNPSEAAGPESTTPAPPKVTAARVSLDVREADPLSADVWRNAAWTIFIAPMNTSATTPATRAAVLYDPANLYVAFICRKSPVADASSTDAVTLFLDTWGEGKELLEVSLDAAARVPVCTWHRSTKAAQPLENGAPDMTVPTNHYPDFKLSSAWSVVREGEEEGQAVWSAVLAIPLADLPVPLRAAASPGAHWKVNLVRTIKSTGGGNRLLQSNLSPIYINAQPVSPYRLADLELGQ